MSKTAAALAPAKPVTLYDLTVEGLELSSILEETGGEMTEDLEKRFDELLKGGKEKIISAYHVVKNLEFEALRHTEEKKRIEAMAKPHADRAKSLTRQAEVLKERMVLALDAAFSGKLQTELYKFNVQSAADREAFAMAPDADIITLSETFPMLVNTTRVLNEQAIKDHFKLTGQYPAEVAHEEIPGKRYLRVY